MVHEIGGSGLMRMYNYSPSAMVTSLYPEYEWLPWKFSGTPRNYWEDVNNIKKYMDWAGKLLGITDKADWQKISYKVKIFIIYALTKKDLRLMDSPAQYTVTELLQIAFPDLKWEEHLSDLSKKSHYVLKKHLEKLFSTESKFF
jgi:hypothetical protein